MIYSGANYGAQQYYRAAAMMTKKKTTDSDVAALSDPDQTLAENIANAAQDNDFLQNLILESGYWLNTSELSYYADLRQRAEAIQAYGLQMLMEFEFRSMAQFNSLAEVSLETVQFYMGNHWSEEDQRIRIAQGMKPYSWPSFTPLVRAFLGGMVAQQTDFRVVPKNKRSAPRVEIANKSLQWVAQQNRLNAVRLDTSRDAVLYGYSVTAADMDPMDPLGRIQIRRARPEEFMFDLNSPTDSTLANVKYVWRGYWRDRVQLAAEYPEWRNEILRPTGLMVAVTGFEQDYRAIRPKVHSPAGSNRIAYSYDPQMEMTYGRLLFVREFYIRRWVDRLVVSDPFEGREYVCNDLQHAARQQAMLEQFYSKTALWGSMSEQVRMSLFQARPKQVEVIDQMIFVGNQLLRVNSDCEGGIPYIFCAPDYYDGDFSAYFEQAKGPQRFEDRIVAALDDLYAGAKQGMIANYGMLKNPNFSAEEFRQKLREPNWTIVVDEQDPEFDVRKVATYVNLQQHGEYLMPLLNYVKSIGTDAYGGPNAQGMAAFAAQSAKSSEDLRAAGSVLTKSIIQKIFDSDRLLGARALYLLQYLSPAVQMRNYGEDLEPVFFSLLEEGIESLGDYDFDVEIKQVIASPAEQQARIARFEALLAFDPTLIEILLPFLLANADIDYSEKQNIIAGVQQRIQGRQQAAAEQAAQAKRELDIKDKVAEGGLMLKGRAQALEELNLPKYSVAYKPAADPLTLADLMNWAAINVPGFSAHPAMLAAGQAAQDMLRQHAITMQQVEEAKHRPDYEKKAIASKVAVKEGYPSAEDDANRAMREVKNGNSS